MRIRLKAEAKGPHSMQLTLEVIRFSAPRTTPSFVKTPIQEPAFDIASIAYLQESNEHLLKEPQRAQHTLRSITYSTWCKRPSGENCKGKYR